MTLGRPLSPFSQRVLDIVRRQPGIGTKDIAAKLGEPLHVVQKTLANLRQQNHIAHSGKRVAGAGWSPAVSNKVPVAEKPLKNGTTTGPWTPSPWTPVRTDAEDHKQHGSLRGDSVQPWMPPISMCVGKGVERFMPDRLQR